MNIIIGKPRTGKTEKLITTSEVTGIPIICPDLSQCRVIYHKAIERGLIIPEPLTLHDFQIGKLKGTGIREILIDNADMILQDVFGDMHIRAITLSENKIIKLK
jgi:hypothetical protein